ncbi:RNA polymerase sigma-70 factor, ECF subfamily [Cyclobacterium xiamenense]|uniref:RNA polymerase sigma-70 factor, ECF subfamily n=1 Tax=Cyclobacterium xiamenense TaxID=1297121 RepID=A0A1H6TS81_9BACT|nr:sigma-70 family RNA polymerase sigma factor [Cyclobacterium xiamenense]SEI78582.1 RNA polymerase sigma-70 factor, ECF subfamily [Cyclobacterium xiamenense]
MKKHLSKELIRGISSADPKSQEELYKQFYSYGMSICLRYATSREESVEILNDGYLKVFQHFDRYDTTRPFTLWFRQILINGAINYYKKNQNHSQTIGLETISEIPDLGKDVADDLKYTEMIQLIQALPMQYRTVFNLYAIEGYDHQEISNMLGISPGTSKSNLHRARQKLRAMLIVRNHEEASIKNE